MVPSTDSGDKTPKDNAGQPPVPPQLTIVDTGKEKKELKPPHIQFVHNNLGLGAYFIATCIVLTMFIYMLWPWGITLPDEKEKANDTTVVVTMVINGSDTTFTSNTPGGTSPGSGTPGAVTEEVDEDSNEGTWKFFGKALPISEEARLILLALLLGALGSYIHAVTSFITYVGNRKLVTSWLWWYLLRPFIGGPLALIFYFVIRGGFLSSGADASSISIYGIAGTSALVGMFSKNAIDKLEEVFTTLFRSKEGKGDAARDDKAVDQIMVESAMIPAHKIATYVIPQNTAINQITLDKIYHQFQGIVTRIPVVTDENKLMYIIHQSILFQYIANQSVTLADLGQQFQLSKITLDLFVNDPKVNDFVEKSIVLVSRKAALIEAKQKMEETRNCQDVFVTENGSKDEPLLGWLTNVDISKNIGEST